VSCRSLIRGVAQDKINNSPRWAQASRCFLAGASSKTIPRAFGLFLKKVLSRNEPFPLRFFSAHSEAFPAFSFLLSSARVRIKHFGKEPRFKPQNKKSFEA